jgi:hypothetical protein
MTTSPSPKLKCASELMLKATRLPSPPSATPHNSHLSSSFKRFASRHNSTAKIVIMA